MARALNGTTQFASVGITPVSGYPCTLAVWAHLAATGAIKVALNVNRFNDGTNFHYFSLGCDASNPPKVKADVNGTASGASETSIVTTATFTTNTWVHLCAVFATTAANGIRVYLNGENKITGTTANTPSGLGRFTVGCWKRLSAVGTSAFWGGRIGQWAVWNAALTDREVKALGKAREHPMRIRPSLLVDGAEWDGNRTPEPSFKGLYSMNPGTAKVRGPAVKFAAYPTMADDSPAAAGGGSGGGAAYHYMRQMGV